MRNAPPRHHPMGLGRREPRAGLQILWDDRYVSGIRAAVENADRIVHAGQRSNNEAVGTLISEPSACTRIRSEALHSQLLDGDARRQPHDGVRDDLRREGTRNGRIAPCVPLASS